MNLILFYDMHLGIHIRGHLCFQLSEYMYRVCSFDLGPTLTMQSIWVHWHLHSRDWCFSFSAESN